MSTLKLTIFRIDKTRDWKCNERICEEVSSVEQKTVRERITKDRAGALPPAACTKQNEFAKEDL